MNHALEIWHCTNCQEEIRRVVCLEPRVMVGVLIQELCKNCRVNSCKDCLHLRDALEGKSWAPKCCGEPMFFGKVYRCDEYGRVLE